MLDEAILDAQVYQGQMINHDVLQLELNAAKAESEELKKPEELTNARNAGKKEDKEQELRRMRHQLS